MKTLFMVVGLLLSFSSYLCSGSLSSSEITNMISKIKEEREGIGMDKLEHTVNPFRLNKKQEVIEDASGLMEELPIEPEYVLEAVLNHAAFINNKWYKNGDTLGIYRVGYVGRSSVTLKSASGHKTLVMKKIKKKKMFIKLNQGKK
ncbi:hypothetical protein KKC13_08060 [bacterium]|nr:hypothetical protein [bacterium]MBU1958495.1 hypothetical protein [bacterium]